MCGGQQRFARPPDAPQAVRRERGRPAGWQRVAIGVAVMPQVELLRGLKPTPDGVSPQPAARGPLEPDAKA